MKPLEGLNRPEYILREEIALVHKNFIISVLAGYNICALICSTVIYWIDNSLDIFNWFFVVIVTSSLVSFIQHRMNKKSAPSLLIAKTQVLSLLSIGLLWGYLPYTYINHPNELLVFIIIVVTVGIMCGGAFMQAPYLPAYLTFLFSITIPITIIFFTAENVIYSAFGLCAIIYSTVLMVCAINLESTIYESIRLRFENSALIEKLQMAVSDTQQANNAKSVFLASASHDLRQPIHALSLFLASFRKTELHGEQAFLLDNIEAATASAQDMLGMLLDYSKLEAGTIDAQAIDFKLQDLFSKLADEYAPVAAEKNLNFRCRESNAIVFSDRKLLELVVRNLISNAIRYTSEGGLLLASRHRGKNIDIEVWDTGIGIEKTEKKHIFNDFYQIDNPERDSGKGFGLGLSIVKKLTLTMGIKLSIESRLGRGTVARLSIPLSINPALISTERRKNTGASLDIYDANILVIDDNTSILDAMNSLLTPYGCNCILVSCESEAIDALNKLSIRLDLIITDYRLKEGKTGGQAISRIREQQNNHTPAIIITGDTSPERLQKALEQDALLMHKPLGSGDLLDAVEKTLSLQPN